MNKSCPELGYEMGILCERPSDCAKNGCAKSRAPAPTPPVAVFSCPVCCLGNSPACCHRLDCPSKAPPGAEEPVAWLDEARVIAAQCWCDKETEHLVMEPALAEAVARRIAAWMQTGAQHATNEEYWRNLARPPAAEPVAEGMERLHLYFDEEEDDLMERVAEDGEYVRYDQAAARIAALKAALDNERNVHVTNCRVYETKLQSERAARMAAERKLAEHMAGATNALSQQQRSAGK